LARPSAPPVLGRRVSAGHKNSAASCFCTPAASAPQPFFRPLMRARRPVLSLGTPWAAPGAFTGHQTACWCSCGLVRVGVRGHVNRAPPQERQPGRTACACPRALKHGPWVGSRCTAALGRHSRPLRSLSTLWALCACAPLRARFWSAEPHTQFYARPPIPPAVRQARCRHRSVHLYRYTRCHQGKPTVRRIQLCGKVVAAAAVGASDAAVLLLLRRLAVTRTPPPGV
jgi:hypothetical protein